MPPFLRLAAVVASCLVAGPVAAAFVTYHFTGTTEPGVVTGLEGGLPVAAELVIDDATPPLAVLPTIAQYPNAVASGTITIGAASYTVGPVSRIDFFNDDPVLGNFVDAFNIGFLLSGPDLPTIGAPLAFELGLSTVSAAPGGPLTSLALSQPWLPASSFATTRAVFDFFSGVPAERLFVRDFSGPTAGPLPPSTVPEPASWLLIALASTLAIGWRQLHRRSVDAQ